MWQKLHSKWHKRCRKSCTYGWGVSAVGTLGSPRVGLDPSAINLFLLRRPLIKVGSAHVGPHP